MSALSTRINNLSESATIKMAKLGRELAAKGVDVISLSFGEPDFHTPEHIKEAAKQAMDKNFTYYTPVSGYPDLRKAVVAKLKNENNLDYDFSQIVVSTGAKQAIANAVLCLVNPGEEVIIPTPYWVSYSEVVKLAEGKSVFINTTVEQNFKITLNDFSQLDMGDSIVIGSGLHKVQLSKFNKFPNFFLDNEFSIDSSSLAKININMNSEHISKNIPLMPFNSFSFVS